ncbi:uncharacterized protein LOC124177840 [Neodiprion fabricii]|uniref:uncharacterized protein LOC124177840 n=1 Tax=Neodiprion fabricii TaxID=2872261 RepID=UPI001ED8D72C|nr:uncharacterized protein LOC124177840 [Neodiprion fabricii]
MKDVYVIKVKTRPPLSSLYPSERRYSASTVGGLALVHLGLGLLGMLLGVLARSIQGPILGLASLVPFSSGLLAWRRWYIDRNISIFFYGSLFSALLALLCSLATLLDITVVSGVSATSEWRLENVFAFGKNDDDEETIGLNVTDSGTFQGGFFTFWRAGDPTDFPANFVLDLNLLVACVLEAFWSLLSVRISLRGMRNLGGSERPANRDCNESENDRITRITCNGFGKKPPTPNPRLILERRGSIDDNEFRFRDISNVEISSGPRLPLPESNTEFRERVERFLANQAAHRIVEGSCS